MRVWIKRKTKNKVLHVWRGSDTACYAIALKKLKIERYTIGARPTGTDRICAACQCAIAVERGKF